MKGVDREKHEEEAREIKEERRKERNNKREREG